MATAKRHDGSERARARGRQGGRGATPFSSPAGDFLAMTCHEIRTPLNAIIGATDLLSATSLTQEQQRYVKLCGSAGENLLRLINDLLDLARLDAGRFSLDCRPFSVTAVLRDCCDVLGAAAHAKNVTLSWSVHADVPAILMGDPGRLRQVLLNLIGNAVKFTDRGSICATVSRTAGETADGPGGAEGAPVELLFSVADSGVGIPSDMLARVFDSFTQADVSTTNRYGGTGLGLAIARSIVQLMHGRIWVESEVRRGSTFQFTAQFGRHEPAAPAQDAPARPATQQRLLLRVLLVEDTPDNRLLARTYLDGHLVAEAEDGAQAVEMFRAGTYDVVLLDMRMPVMDGFAAARLMRQWESDRGLPATPIIALTAYAYPDEIRQCRDAGCTLHLAKPFRRDELVAAIAACHCGGTDDFAPSHPHERSAATAHATRAPEARPERVRVRVDRSLAAIVPGFLEHRLADVIRLEDAIASGNFAQIDAIGHAMKGTGGGYGFPAISDIGRRLELAGRERDTDAASQCLRDLAAYLSSVEPVYA
ncbi:response regulator [bacterium]|nr:response regulator [bacterium]